MKIPTKKLKSGFEMPVFGLGTWMMGGGFEHDPQNDDNADIQAIKNAIDIGITHIDTAERYADGYAETLVGKAIKENKREKLFLVSKVAPWHLHYDDLLSALEASLKRLQTEYLDLYLIHQPNPEIPIKETMRALDYAKKQGLIKHMGVCNFTIQRFQEAQLNTSNIIVANQLHYNLMSREPEHKGLVTFCQENDVMFIAWRPVQKGVLTKEQTIVSTLCKKYKKTPSQIAINWLLSQSNIVTLSKMRSTDHLKENLGALDWEMDQEDVEKLRHEFPDQMDVSDAVPLI